jgi:YVTN family beta-propeller protein
VPKVFISYRRSDTTPGYASWIYDRLAETFGAANVFMDIDSLPLGVDFVEELEQSLHQTDVALILIGPHWLSAADESGARRLDDPDDFVRLEVAAALRADTRVIPVLVDGAAMPPSTDLPDELRFLARRQGLVFQRHGGTAIRELMSAIHDAGRPAPAPEAEVPAAVPEPEPEPHPPSPEPPPARPKRRQRRGLLLVAAAALAAGGVAAAVIAAGGSSTHHRPPTPRGPSLPVGEIAVGNSPDGIVIRQGIVWVANAGDATITKIDEASGHVIGKITYANHSEAAAPIAVWQDALWVGDSRAGTLDELDPATGKMLGAPIHLGGQPCAVTAVAGSLWVGNFNGTITRIVAHPAAGGGSQFTPSTIQVPSGPKRMTGSGSNLWVANYAEGSVTRLDANTGAVLATVTVGGHPGAINAFQGGLWIADRARNTLTRVDPTSIQPVGSPIAIGKGPRRISGSGNDLWISDAGDGTVTKVDTTTGTVVAQVKVGGRPDSLTISNGVVWVATWSGPMPTYHGPSGGVLRIDESTAQVIRR